MEQRELVTQTVTLGSSAQWPEGLKRLLTEGEDGGAACRLIAINPTLKRQAEEMLPALERAKEVAERGEVLRILIQQAPVYALPDKTDAEWEHVFAAYVDALADFSVHAIQDAFRRWNRGEDMKDPAMGQFFPKPAQLVHLAKKARTEVWVAAGRARKALEYVETMPRQIPPEEKAQVAAGLKELAATFKPKPLPETMKPLMTREQVADRIRDLDTVPMDDVGIVI